MSYILGFILGGLVVGLVMLLVLHSVVSPLAEIVGGFARSLGRR